MSRHEVTVRICSTCDDRTPHVTRRVGLVARVGLRAATLACERCRTHDYKPRTRRLFPWLFERGWEIGFF